MTTLAFAIKKFGFTFFLKNQTSLLMVYIYTHQNRWILVTLRKFAESDGHIIFINKKLFAEKNANVCPRTCLKNMETEGKFKHQYQFHAPSIQQWKTSATYSHNSYELAITTRNRKELGTSDQLSSPFSLWAREDRRRRCLSFS